MRVVTGLLDVQRWLRKVSGQPRYVLGFSHLANISRGLSFTAKRFSWLELGRTRIEL